MNNTTYSAGTVSVPAAGLTVTGSGTAWATFGVRAGDMILIGGQLALIASVNSNTSITLKRAWTGGAQSGTAYDILLLDDEVRALIAANSLLQALSGGTLTSLGEIAGAANKMPYWTGAGVMAATDLSAAARTLLDDASIAAMRDTLGLTLTASMMDGALNRVTRSGDYGIGSNASANTPTVQDLDDFATPAGFYRQTTGATGGTYPPGFSPSSAYFVAVQCYGEGNRTQWIWRHTITASNSVWVRNSVNSVWGAWRLVMAHEIVGIAANAGGAPSGAIIERGSNASGEYTKFADGTLICTRPSLFATYLATPRLGVNWAFPAAFASGAPLPTVVAAFRSSEANIPFPSAPALATTKPPSITQGVPNTTGVNFRIWAPDGFAFSSSDVVELTLMAIGRWYVAS